MRGIIVSHAPSARSGPFAWADVPGVTYPAEAFDDYPRWVPQDAVDLEEWTSTAFAAKTLGLTSAAAARRVLHAALVDCQLRATRTGRTLYWRRQVLAVAHNRATKGRTNKH